MSFVGSGIATMGTQTLSVTLPDLEAVDGQEALPALFVPVDATRASRRVLDVALDIARRRSMQVILIGMLRDPSPDGLEDDEIATLLLAAEYGYGAAVPRYADDEEARLTRLVRLVLLPYQRYVEAAGVPASMRVVSAALAPAQVRVLLDDAQLAGKAIVLGNPDKLEGPLRALTLDLFASPPCTQYLTGFPGVETHAHGGHLRRLVNRLSGSARSAAGA
jgi:hypothetical protein